MLPTHKPIFPPDKPQILFLVYCLVACFLLCLIKPIYDAHEHARYSTKRACMENLQRIDFHPDCLRNLQAIDAAKTQWALANKKKPGDTPTWGDLLPYTSPTLKTIPSCPDGGTYTLGAIGMDPECSLQKRSTIDGLVDYKIFNKYLPDKTLDKMRSRQPQWHRFTKAHIPSTARQAIEMQYPLETAVRASTSTLSTN